MNEGAVHRAVGLGVWNLALAGANDRAQYACVGMPIRANVGALELMIPEPRSG